MKLLSPNDNSKNQVYLGGDLGVVNVIPANDPVAATSGSQATPIFKATMSFSWLDDDGGVFNAPNAQLILYPQYPEVRFSGFLRGARWSPAGVMRVRDAGRVLLIGVTSSDDVIGYAAFADSPVARELRNWEPSEAVGVLLRLPIDSQDDGDSRSHLLKELCRVANAGWIDGWTLGTDGSRRPCTAPNCVGVTLESELGITANGRSDPDFDGWEVKAHTVGSFATQGSGAVTLMTPEPTSGFYVDEGPEAFVRKYGYVDMRGREDRLNFGGIHRVGHIAARTNLTLRLDGFDLVRRSITRADGQLALVDRSENVAAAWSFERILAHWKRKHSRAAFVPALKRSSPTVSFQYGSQVSLAQGTDYVRLLAVIGDGTVYYDPGIKLENASTAPHTKRRSQFRVKRTELECLYHSMEAISVCEPTADSE